MDRLAKMNAFVKVVELGSFTLAAKRLNMATTLVSRNVRDLEAWLGVKLLERTTRKVVPTEIGRQFFSRISNLLGEVAEIESMAGQFNADPRGLLRVSSSMAFGVARVAAALSAFARSHPGIEVELIITNRPIDLIEEQVDIAIHVGLLRDSGLRSRTLTTFNSVVCASPGYLADRGTPLMPSDIGRHNCITYASGGGAPGDWRFLDANGPIQVEIASSTFKSNSAGAVVVAALDGQGLALVPDYLVREHLESGALVEVLQQYRPAPSLVRALYAPGRFLPAKSRAFIDHLVEYFAVPQ